MDLIIVFYVNVEKLSMIKREEYLKVVVDSLPKHDKIKYFVMGSDHDDVKVIPVKCYLEGVLVETTAINESLVEELRDLTENLALKTNQ